MSTIAKVSIVVTPTQFKLIDKALARYADELKETLKTAHANDMRGLRAEQITLADLREKLQ